MANRKYQKLFIVLGDQLFPNFKEFLDQPDQTLVFMAEDHELATHYRYHKHKLIFFFTSMRAWAQSQQEKGLSVDYYTLQENKQSFQAKLDNCLKANPDIKEVEIFEVDDAFFDSALRKMVSSLGLELSFHPSPKFLFSREDFKEYLEQSKRPFLKTYYERQRKALNLLLEEDGEPIGGKWSFDEANRKKLPKNHQPPMPLEFESPAALEEVMELVENHFPEHPGELKGFNWACTRTHALEALDHFLDEKLALFGPYEDAFEADHQFLYHSTLSPYLNNGLLTPEEVLEAVISKYRSEEVHYPSVEGFVRQLVGWREFMRGLYLNQDFSGNHFGFKRKMKDCWYQGNTGIPPLDDAIKKVLKSAYNHHIERLMILGNIMLMCELEPTEVYKWFMEMYIDSADWVMEPNVMGMSQFADGGSFATKPYIAGSNYLRKMSHYPKGDWCDIVDGLYWRFIDRQRETFANNHRMGMMLATLKKMDADRKERIFKAAENWIESVSFEA